MFCRVEPMHYNQEHFIDLFSCMIYSTLFVASQKLYIERVKTLSIICHAEKNLKNIFYSPFNTHPWKTFHYMVEVQT